MTMYLVFEKTNILKLFNNRVNLSTSLMCALRIFHWNLIEGNFFTQDCEKKIDCRKKRIQKMCLCHCLKYNFMRQLRRDARLFACTVSLGSFPTSTHILCCGLRAIYYECTHDGDMLCITGTTH